MEGRYQPGHDFADGLGPEARIPVLHPCSGNPRGSLLAHATTVRDICVQSGAL